MSLCKLKWVVWTMWKSQLDDFLILENLLGRSENWWKTIVENLVDNVYNLLY